MSVNVSQFEAKQDNTSEAASRNLFERLDGLDKGENNDSSRQYNNNDHILRKDNQSFVFKELEREKTSKIKQLTNRKDKLNQIITAQRLCTFVYCLIAFEIALFIYYTWMLISNFSDITKISTAYIYIMDYFFSLINIILYSRYTVQFNSESKKGFKHEGGEGVISPETQKLKSQNEGTKTKNKLQSILFSIKMQSSLLINNNFLDMYHVTNQPDTPASLKYLIFFVYFRILTWICKFMLYLILIYFSKDFFWIEYLKIAFISTEYFIYLLLKFFLKVVIKTRDTDKELNKLSSF